MRRHRVEVHPVETRTGVRAGQLLGAVGAGSELAADAFLVADADLRGGAVIATCDSDDLGRLASEATRVSVADLDTRSLCMSGGVTNRKKHADRGRWSGPSRCGYCT